jgi:dihydroxyacetone kinase
LSRKTLSLRVWNIIILIILRDFIPGSTVPATHLGVNEDEIGLSIHNEASPVPPLNELIPIILQMITSTVDKERSFVPFKNDVTDYVVLVVNNLRSQ